MPSLNKGTKKTQPNGNSEKSKGGKGEKKKGECTNKQRKQREPEKKLGCQVRSACQPPGGKIKNKKEIQPPK